MARGEGKKEKKTYHSGKETLIHPRSHPEWKR